ncbi:hypothetical protein [Gordonia soli]|uniref:Cupin 2 conserved barrel domain-containing protein n=1 Tax=Gordonia soli NBRC 108243 TaxID=1223545 RepID=M0QNZ0_9ACTN|nr:hypothetical protein [Gordonia soli]GAC70129.1 hypothetical protein GS4_32_00730 [Gordonia soli NBRC 108243]
MPEHAAATVRTETAGGPPSGWTRLDGLDAVVGDAGSTRPDVGVRGRTPGATVIRLSFRAGQVMADHHANRPILVIGQRGEIEFTVGDAVTLLLPGTAIGVDPQVGHSLRARTDAVATLVVLGDAPAS